MTIKETILNFPGLTDFPERYLDVIISGRKLTGDTSAKTVEARVINLLIADALRAAVNLPDFSEGKLSVQYPRSYFLKTASSLYRENGEGGKAIFKIPRGRANSGW